jgi:hypothetical protein
VTRLALVLLAGCSTAEAMAPAPPPPPHRIATAWEKRCLRSLEQARVEAGKYEPELRTAEVAISDSREEAILHAGPPVWHIPSVSVFVEPDGKPTPTWGTFAEYLGGGLHILSSRGSAAAVMLDGWDEARAARIEPILRAAADRCLAP